MGNVQTIPKIHFEELQEMILTTNKNDFCLVNTIEKECQQCLIQQTIPVSTEEETINQLIKKKQFNTCIVVYGKNYHDSSILKKYNQFVRLGFKKVRIFFGGLFEWLCLQEIYGNELFPTNVACHDLLKYK